MRLGIIGLPQSGKTTIFNALTRGHLPLTTSGGRFDVHTGVVVGFEDENVPHPSGSVNPQRDITTMDSELLLNDMIAVERKLERLADERKKGGGRERSVIDREAVLFERFKETLSGEIPLREIDLTAEEEKTLSGFGFLTRKPMLVLLNLYEGQDTPPLEYPHTHTNLVALQGKLEMEIAQLSPEDAGVFMG